MAKAKAKAIAKKQDKAAAARGGTKGISGYIKGADRIFANQNRNRKPTKGK